VDVPVSRLAAEAEDVEALGGDGAAERLADAVDARLEREVLVEREVAGNLLAVLLRRDEHVAVQGLEALEERHRVLVLEDDVMAELGIAPEQLADEAPAGEPPVQLVEIDPSAPHRRAS
jgi:hypothetical protein